MIDVSAIQPEPLPPAGERPRISCLAIVTRNRLPQLRRCLVTSLAHLRRHGRVCDIVVCDDSESAATRSACRQLLASLAHRFGARIFYAGPVEKLAYSEKLAGQGIPPGMARFALLNQGEVALSPGANRNASLLHCAGQAFLAFDDDCVCRVEDLRRGAQTVAIVPFASTAERAEFPPKRPAAGNGPRPACDLLAAHEGLLGRSLPELVLPIRNTARVSAAAFGARVFADLLEDKGRVALTVSGVHGDSGLPHAAPFMTAAGEARARFLQAWEAANDWNGTRYVRLGVTRPTLSWNGPVATTTATGFDHRQLLPPFSPAGRGEDSLFGMMLGRCLPHSYIGYVPVSLRHAPAGPREYGALPAAARLVDIVAYLLDGCADSPARAPEDRLKAAGRHLVDWGRAPLAEFEAQVLCQARRSRVSGIEQCERLLAAHGGAPEPWARETERWIADLERGLAGREAALPSDLSAPAEPGQALARTRDYVRRFGELLQAWPDFVAIACRLGSAGERVGVLAGG